MFKHLVSMNRSYRRFHESSGIGRDVLVELVDLARLSASAANLQPLKYILSADQQSNNLIFHTLRWAGYLADWDGPKEGERPSAYIVVLGDTRIANNFGCDHGIACQSILLGAVEKGLGGCIFASIDREALRSALSIPDYLDILLVVALGRPVEKVVVVPVGSDGSIRYYRDSDDVHFVPKRDLNEIIIG